MFPNLFIQQIFENLVCKTDSIFVMIHEKNHKYNLSGEEYLGECKEEIAPESFQKTRIVDSISQMSREFHEEKNKY